MSQTAREALQLCQPQERNISNKIFGGFLMRKAFELAFVTAYLHARTQPFFYGLDGPDKYLISWLIAKRFFLDVSFQRPVEIGAMLHLRAIVAFTTQRDLLVEVTAHVIDAEKAIEHLTNKYGWNIDNFFFFFPFVS